MMYVKVHTSGERFHNRIVVAVCDAQLLGKTLSQGDISFTISEHFYKGERKRKAEVVKILKDAPNCNLVGKEAVEAGIVAGKINKESVILIEGVPHGQAIGGPT